MQCEMHIIVAVSVWLQESSKSGCWSARHLNQS